MSLTFQLTKSRRYFSFSDDVKTIADFRYNEHSNSFRLNASTKRLLFIEPSGLLQNKLLLKTEYGIEIGEWMRMRNYKSGIVHLNSNRFTYNIGLEGIEMNNGEANVFLQCQPADIAELTKQELAAILFCLAWVTIETCKKRSLAKESV